MLKPFTLLALFFLNQGLIYAQDQDACGIKLNKHAPIYHQGKSSMWSFATTQILNSQYRILSISPVWVSLMSKTLGIKVPTEAMKSISNQSFLCEYNKDLEPTTNEVMDFDDFFKTEARELQERLKIISMVMAEPSYTERYTEKAKQEGYDTLEEYQKSLSSKYISEFKSKIKEKFYKTFSFKDKNTSFRLDESEFNSKLDSFIADISNEENITNDNKYIDAGAIEFSILGYSTYCKAKKIRSKFKNISMKNQDLISSEDIDCNQIKNSIDEKLKSNWPVIVGLNQGRLYSKGKDRRGSGHYMTIVGKRCVDEKKEPEYLIRNSFGASSCTRFRGGRNKTNVWDCDKNTGEFWLPLSEICKNAGDLYFPNEISTNKSTRRGNSNSIE